MSFTWVCFVGTIPYFISVQWAKERKRLEVKAFFWSIVTERETHLFYIAVDITLIHMLIQKFQK